MSVKSGSGTFYVDCAMKAQQWGRAKGELRALVGISGSYAQEIAESEVRWKTTPRWQRLQEKVNAFIQDVEDNGLHE